MARLSDALDVYLAPRAVVHGVLMDILGLGVLIVGESGIGKSECALDLVVRGHRLVADDAVELRARADVVPDGHLPGADAASHGDPRARPDQRAGPVRRRLDADVEAGRARRAARAMGSRARVRSARPRRGALRDARRARADAPACRWRPGATSPSSWKWRRATSCCATAGTTRRGGSSIASTRELGTGARDGRSRVRRGSVTKRGRRRAARARRERHAAGARRGRRWPRGSSSSPGLSGAGKSQAIRALEDLGYFCVDNLPVALLPMLAELTLRAGNEIARAAVVVDVREGQDARRSSRGVYRRLKAMREPATRCSIFLDASDDGRSSAGSARRAGRIRWRRTGPALEGIREERQRMQAAAPAGRPRRRYVGDDGARAAARVHGTSRRDARRARSWSSRS